MIKKAVERLVEYLDSECYEYGLMFDYTWVDDCDWFEVEIKSDFNGEISCLNFRYIEDRDVLEIELSDDCWYETKEYDSSVKYFWMKVSPDVFK